jgi:hypothetical protein
MMALPPGARFDSEYMPAELIFTPAAKTSRLYAGATSGRCRHYRAPLCIFDRESLRKYGVVRPSSMTLQPMARRERLAAQVRTAPRSWPRSWANSSLFWLHAHRNAWANSFLSGQPDAFLAAPAGWPRSRSPTTRTRLGSRPRARRRTKA